LEIRYDAPDHRGDVEPLFGSGESRNNGRGQRQDDSQESESHAVAFPFRLIITPTRRQGDQSSLKAFTFALINLTYNADSRMLIIGSRRIVRDSYIHLIRRSSVSGDISNGKSASVRRSARGRIACVMRVYRS
jgi:hypothetical protein